MEYDEGDEVTSHCWQCDKVTEQIVEYLDGDSAVSECHECYAENEL